MFNITCIRKKEYLGMKKKKKKYLDNYIVQSSMHKKERVFRDEKKKKTQLCLTCLCPILPLRGDGTGTGFACCACPDSMCIYIFYLIYIKKVPLYFIFISSVSFRLVKYIQLAPNLHHPSRFLRLEEGNGAEMGGTPN